MKDEKRMQEKLNMKPVAYSNISHTVVNFVDDSNSMICFFNHEDPNHYINSYFAIRMHYYTLNKLQINPEKTNLLVIVNQTMRNQNENIRTVTDTEDVLPKKQI